MGPSLPTLIDELPRLMPHMGALLEELPHLEAHLEALLALDRPATKITLEDEAMLRGKAFVTKKEDEADRCSPPPISECWDPLHRWREALRTRWQRSEHQNVLELRTIILAV